MSSIPFFLLPAAVGSAAENMADDLLMLEQFSHPEALRFRHYSWSRPAFTFGYSQKYRWARREANSADSEICRRATGGVLVDHRNDWTYGLVIPPGHELFRGPLDAVYRIAHEILGESLNELGMPAATSHPGNPDGNDDDARSNLPGVCFDRAERADLVVPGTIQKIAGAAMKRNRHGFLLQGSVDKSAAPDSFPWKHLRLRFTSALARGLQADAPPGDCDFPAAIPGPRADMRARFASPAWNERR